MSEYLQTTHQFEQPGPDWLGAPGDWWRLDTSVLEPVPADAPAPDAAPTLAGTFRQTGPMPDGVWDDDALDAAPDWEDGAVDAYPATLRGVGVLLMLSAATWAAIVIAGIAVWRWIR